MDIETTAWPHGVKPNCWKY